MAKNKTSEGEGYFLQLNLVLNKFTVQHSSVFWVLLRVLALETIGALIRIQPTRSQLSKVTRLSD